MFSHIGGLTLNDPASETEISSVRYIERFPEDYVSFIRQSNGAFGFVGPAYLILFSAEKIDKLNDISEIEERAPRLRIFGSDGGRVSYCFDLSGCVSTIVEIGTLDIGSEAPKFCADSFSGFLDYLRNSD